MIIEAEITDHNILSKITKASKAHWGYSKEQMRIWDDDLTIKPDYINKHIVFKLIKNDQPIGYYSLEIKKESTIKLENMFIIPEYIGKGFGKLLLEHAFKKAIDMGHKEMVLDADPNAYLFYKKYGFKIIGKKETSIKGRYMPIMQKSLIP